VTPTSNLEEFSTSQAARQVQTAPSTIFRWIVHGVRIPGGQRLRLRAKRIGGAWRVEKAALDDFIRLLTEAHRPEQAPPLPRSSGRRQHAADRAGRRLAEMGA